MGSLEVNFVEIEKIINDINKDIATMREKKEAFMKIVNEMSVGWEDSINNSYIKYQQSVSTLTTVWEEEFKKIEQLLKLITDSMQVYIDNETVSAQSIGNVIF